MAHEPLDPVDLLARLDGDRELMVQLAEIFLAEAPGLMSEARRVVGANDAPGLARTAHSLKGSLGCLGANGAWAAADALETMGRASDLAGANLQLADLTQQVDDLTLVLSRLCNEQEG